MFTQHRSWVILKISKAISCCTCVDINGGIQQGAWLRMTCFGLQVDVCHQKQRTYRQRHGHDHVSPVHSWNIQDAGAGTRVWINPLDRTGRLAHAGRRSTQRRRESPNGVSHQHGRAGLNCSERKWPICNSITANV